MRENPFLGSQEKIGSKTWLFVLALQFIWINTLNNSLQMHSKVVTQICTLIHLERNNMSKFSTLKSYSRNESDGLNYFPKTKALKTELKYIHIYSLLVFQMLRKWTICICGQRIKVQLLIEIISKVWWIEVFIFYVMMFFFWNLKLVYN